MMKRRSFLALLGLMPLAPMAAMAKSSPDEGRIVTLFNGPAGTQGFISLKPGEVDKSLREIMAATASITIGAGGYHWPAGPRTATLSNNR